MNATQYPSAGVRPVLPKSPKSESQKSKNSLADSSGSSKNWMSGCDEKWINHYTEEWQAFIEERSSQKSCVAGNFSGRDALPCVWNMPAV
jgi:hypothetical protein